jgi:SAM-dependent methyltransferase
VREGELETLPFTDASFDAVTAVNSAFYAADIAAAMLELGRVVVPGGRVVVTAWGPPQKCEALTAVMPLIAPLMPPPPPGASTAHPGALSEPGALASTLVRAGLTLVDKGEVACPFVYPSIDASWRASATAGPIQLAIAHSGAEKVRAAFERVDRSRMRRDGSIRCENVFLWAAGERPR